MPSARDGVMGFVPPPYPYDRLAEHRAKADALEGGAVDLSAGTPTDPPPLFVLTAMAEADAERGYPPSIGTLALREAAAGWIERRFGVRVDPGSVAACVGTKELVAGLPQLLRLRTPERDTVLYPEVSYPTYAMGAVLAGCRAVPVPLDDDWCIDLSAVAADDAERALCLWVNTPGNPAGGLDDLGAAAEWGRARGVPVISDECYAEFTWEGAPRTILEHGSEGVLAVHSVSKRSNLAGLRVGFYAGDPDLVHYLGEVRKHAGLMVPGPAQAGAVAALADDHHVTLQRDRYRERLEVMAGILTSAGYPTSTPRGSFYLWAPVPDGDEWAAVAHLAAEGGAVVAPGEFFREGGVGRIRVAMVQPTGRLRLVAQRLGVDPSTS